MYNVREKRTKNLTANGWMNVKVVFCIS